MHCALASCGTLLACFALASQVLPQDPTYSNFASGCPGSAGIPLLEADAGSLPELGSSFRARLSNVPAVGFAVGITGLSTTTWSGFTLPLDLGLIGMPGCTLYTDMRRTATIIIVGGQGTWDTNLPSSPEWLGQRFYQQVFVVDGSIPGLGAVMSNACEGIIGTPNTAPVASIAFPPPISLTDEDTILVRGHASDPQGVAELRVNGALATTSDDFANWQVRVPIDVGSNILTVETRDSFGASDPQAATASINPS